MNSPNPSDPWARLTRAARSAPARQDETVPFGFATRVVARAAEVSGGGRSFVEKFAFRAVAVAALLALGSVGLELTQTSSPRATAQPTEATADDALSALVNA